MKKLCIIILSIFFLISCSSKPISENTGIPVPDNLILNKSIVSKQNGFTPVTFLRDTGPGFACSHTIYIDGEQAFHIQDAQFITVYLPKGDHFFRLTSGHGMCPNIDISQNTILKDKQQKFRIMFQANSGTIHLIRVQ